MKLNKIWSKNLDDRLGGDSTRDRLLDQFQGFFAVTLFSAGIVEVLGAGASPTWEIAFKFLALNLILGGAAGLTGGVLGFIFGVPRALTSSVQGNNTQDSGTQTSAANTNLEQISDWLTKILVGASLTSLTAIPGFLEHLAKFLDGHGYDELPGKSILAIFIIIYFEALGFFWGYLEARTSITKMFRMFGSDSPMDSLTLQTIRSAASEPGTEPIPDDPAILAIDVDQLKSVPLLEARGGAETRARNWTGAVAAYQQALKLDPGNTRIQGKLSLVLANAGKTQDAERIIQQTQQAVQRAGNLTSQNQLEVNKVYVALYKPNGYKEALSIGEPLLLTDQASNAWLHLYLACAYGQRAAAAKIQGQNYDDDKAQTLSHLKETIRLKPELRKIALSLWRPDQYGGSSTENDLEIFNSDSDFSDLLLG